MVSLDIIKPLSAVLSSGVYKSRQCGEANPRLLGAMLEYYPLCYAAPFPVIFKVKFLLFRWMWPRWFRWKETKTKVRKDLLFLSRKVWDKDFFVLVSIFCSSLRKKSFFFVATLKFFLNKHIPLERRLPSGRNARWGLSNNPIWAYKTCLTCKTCTSIRNRLFDVTLLWRWWILIWYKTLFFNWN